MASAAPVLSVADRNDIHKSCKTLEVVVNVLNDYCEAANAILSLQKKLARALRDASSVRCVAEIPANALNASATIFETLSDIDSRFVKLADKECDGISAELKKWFKRLAKEERAHDDRIASANAKIKQAGLQYEKKSKKNPQGAAEEHTRYINLLSTLGPEINNEKYNHALLVTRKHSGTMHTLAACLSRVADGEWLRSCEGVRRFSTTIGQLGEWRTYCEAGWSGSAPADLPKADVPQNQSIRSIPPVQTNDDVTPNADNSSRELKVPLGDSPAPEYSSRHASEQDLGASSRAITPSGDSPAALPQYLATPGRKSPPRLTVGKNLNDSTTSLASLASFPSPPTHFPLPPVPRSPVSQADVMKSESSSGHRPLVDTTFPRVAESPAQLTPTETSHQDHSPATWHSESPASDISRFQVQDNMRVHETSSAHASVNDHLVKNSDPPAANATASETILPPVVEAHARTSLPEVIDDEDHDVDFGVKKAVENFPMLNAKNLDASIAPPVQRSDTGRSNGSVVASLRDRYNRPAESTSPKREVPRLPTSVSRLATQYETSAVAPTSPSPPQNRSRASTDMTRRIPPPESSVLPSAAKQVVTGHAPAAIVDDIAIRRQRIEELEELELREQELELRMKEREIGRKAKELEAERARLLYTRSPDSGHGSDATRGGIVNRLSKYPQLGSFPSQPPSRAQYVVHSYSTTNLQPQPTSPPTSSQQSSSQPSSPLFRPTDHAPYCGCEACSTSKYRSQESSLGAADVRPRQPPIIGIRAEKPKGWIRRLSMPVGNAFSLDSKKNLGGAGVWGGSSSRTSLVLPGEDGVMLQKTITGGIKNRSTTNLARR
ncbi:uncharacterized protein LAESUDRAFT_813047 [Laetiporus sulphureus 93-53]|uniref:IMD domain-containing protein n=1 Tax=Laetiporus sulphureus 93-53 TaxID=1314785 RepID=A0A165E2S5_9APHY|nr:uncharacterized protein LAESUDRAFT_813047 [Laetiporus sulphureus 93-53]KZT06136.1 hypothetical protein LAESUDRAFT_813047 [Laetiporus sulphureus 93-53]